MWEGVRQHHAEADLLFFAGGEHDVETGDPLVWWSARPWKGPDVGLGQARIYAFWLKPAHYLVTDGDYFRVLRLQHSHR
jgi:hypothetical protein